MNSIEYMKNVKRSESPNFKMISKRLIHGAIGICTEAGELTDVLKKALFYNRTLDYIDLWKLEEEIGDIFWYLGLMCDELGVTFEEVMDKNIKKLKERYPNQFTEEDEQNRDYQREKEAAEEKPTGYEEDCGDTRLGRQGVDI